jgi:hypothetical protein
MKKQELLSKLIEASKTEESATTIYLKHLSALTSRFNIDKEFIERAKKIIAILIDGNRNHKKICDDLIKKIQNEAKNDY